MVTSMTDRADQPARSVGCGSRKRGPRSGTPRPCAGARSPRTCSRVDRITVRGRARRFSGHRQRHRRASRRVSLAETGGVVMLTKADPRESNTGYAQGGIAAAIGEDDSPELHFSGHDGRRRRTLRARGGQRAVRTVHATSTSSSSGARVRSRSARSAGTGREAAHSVRRVLHARDATGREIGRVLWQKVQAHPARRGLRGCARDVARRHAAAMCRGAEFVDRNGTLEQVEAGRTLIATGGAGQVFAKRRTPRSRPATAWPWPSRPVRG